MTVGHAHGTDHGHGHGETQNKKIALLISVMALFLALSEMLAKSAQTTAIGYNVEAANLWAFFQAKTIRRTLVLTAAEALSVGAAGTTDDAIKAAIEKQLDAWKKTAARYRSEPDVREGTVELAERAKHSERMRDTVMVQYHLYELASAAFQIGIVLASAMVITSMAALAWLAGAVGIGGLGLMGLGFFRPELLHLLH